MKNPESIKKKVNREKRYKEALQKIASASKLKHEIRDYANIAKNAARVIL